MHYYRRRPLNGDHSSHPMSGNPTDAPAQLARSAVSLMRPLLPFPGAGIDSLQSGLPAEGLAIVPALAPALADGANAVMRTAGSQDPAMATALSRASAVEEVPEVVLAAINSADDTAGATLPMAASRSVTDQASALLPRAADILDEEMARGVLAAQGSSAGLMPAAQRSPVGSMPAALGVTTASMPVPPGIPAVPAAAAIARVQEAANLLGRSNWPAPVTDVPAAMGGGDLARDLNSFVERFAGLLARPAGDEARHADTATLSPRAPVRPGSTAAIEFDLHNEETRVMVLRPVPTVLISEAGAQMPAECVRSERGEITLGPGERHTLRLNVQVPAAAAPGHYTGLLVMVGAAQLHSLITVNVATA